MDRNRGFTLIELIMTMAVAAILFALAAPSFTSIIKGDTASTQANGLVSILAYARSEAVKQDVVVTVCPSADATNTTCGADWTQTLIVTCSYNAANPPNDCDPNGAGTTTLRVQSPIPSGYELLFNGANNRVQFQPSGTAGAPPAPASFTLCDQQREQQFARDIEVLSTGRAEVSPYPGENFQQHPLTC